MGVEQIDMEVEAAAEQTATKVLSCICVAGCHTFCKRIWVEIIHVIFVNSDFAARRHNSLLLLTINRLG
jgi:hypothetical protein